MPHGYPLYTTVEVECLCCGSLQPFRFTAATDQVVCTHCTKHLGSDKAERRDREHVALWSAIDEDRRARFAALAAQAAADAATAAAALAALSAQVAELSRTVIGQFDAEPGSGVRAELQNELVRRAERKAELAGRYSDRLMVVLWRLAALHHPDAAHASRCNCGTAITACAEFRLADAERAAIAQWESKQLGLLRAGARHALPAEHPEVAAARK
ncbi:hypothetical protein [Rathayibacter soli]|uniref:hypothetical protein n=1 Tax=Rathayibacter soli TaxID=3144168 RepID=UPI0027E47101|nr:hypothetical protein [Glaciibacter superstes]